MNIKKIIRATLSANLLLLFVFAFLPVLAIKPDVEFIQGFLNYMNRD